MASDAFTNKIGKDVKLVDITDFILLFKCHHPNNLFIHGCYDHILFLYYVVFDPLLDIRIGMCWWREGEKMLA